MGGSGSGRPRTKLYGDYSKFRQGKFNMLSSRRFKTFAYIQNGQKYYGIKDKFSGEVYKKIDEETYENIVRRFASQDADKVLSRMQIYTKTGRANRAETARGNIISALNNMFDTNAVFTVKGKEYTLQEILKKLDDLQYSEKWIDFANKNKDFIDSFFKTYKAETGLAPDSFAGMGDYEELYNNDQDTSSSDNYERMFSFIEDLVTTFKI